jgi:hypothetical protein
MELISEESIKREHELEKKYYYEKEQHNRLLDQVE